MESTDTSTNASAARPQNVEQNQIEDEQPNDVPPVGINVTTTGKKAKLDFQDHFSLGMPSSTVRFRSNQIQVYQERTRQLVVETGHDVESDANANEDFISESVNSKQRVKVKSVSHYTLGLSLLRGFYTLVTVLVTGFLFIFCFQIIVYLFMDLAYLSGFAAIDNKGLQVMSFLFTLLAVPLYVYGLSSIMTIAACFVGDTWNGHTFLRTVGNWSSVKTEWACFLVYLAAPLLTITITLFMKMPNWWEISALVWFSAVFGFYICFAFAVLYYEIVTCVKLVRMIDPPETPTTVSNGDDIARRSKRKEAVELAKKCILRMQIHRLSGRKRCTSFVDHTVDLQTGESYATSDKTLSKTEYTDPYSKFTRLSCWKNKVFIPIDPPKRIYSSDEVLQNTPFITSETWSLEKIYCGPHDSRTVSLVHGPSALRPSQVRSSLACAILGNAMSFLFCVALLVWLGANALSLLVMVVLLFLLFIPSVHSALRSYRVFADVKKHSSAMFSRGRDNDGVEESRVASPNVTENTGSDGITQTQNARPSLSSNPSAKQSEGIFRVCETFRVTRASDQLCWAVFYVEIICFFTLPLIFLFVAGNVPLGSLFVVIGILSTCRHYFNMAVVIREIGSLDALGKGNAWKKQSRLCQIVKKVSSNRRRHPWIVLFSLLMLLFLAISIGSLNAQIEDGDGGQTLPVALPDFYYNPQPRLPYPTCNLRKGLEIPGDPDISLLDYVFLTRVAFLSVKSTQPALNTWFDKSEMWVTDKQDVVDAFKAENPSAVFYKLISFETPSDIRVGVVTIRGTTNAWDVFTNFQLWFPTMLSQGIRFILPLGPIWTPILKYFVKMVSILGAESLDRVSYYKHITRFVELVQRSGNYTTVHVAGHSLGGGLAMISGAQTGAPAIALSGPNSMLTRLTFSPQLTVEQLNTLVFNIVPDRDIVPRIDDLAHLYQRIDCRAPTNSIFGCHSGMRGLCEILFTCGSSHGLTDTRPVLCDCAEKYGYPEPTQNGTRSFQEACMRTSEKS